ncbi:hypothetical protein GCM10027055_02040 [Janibacter alkaliphilus]
MNLMTDPTAIAYRTARDRVIRAPRPREHRIARWLRRPFTDGTASATTSGSSAQAHSLGTRRAAAHGG